MVRVQWLGRSFAAIPALLLALALTPMARAGISYQISVDTSGVVGQSAYVDFQFNPANPGSTPLATARVSEFTGYSGSLGSPANTGATSGDLESTLVLNNTSLLNSSYAALTLGSSLQFLLRLEGPAFNESSSNGSSFVFALYDSSGGPLNGTDPTVVRIDMVPFETSPGVSLSPSGAPAYAGGAAAQVTAVPEASTTVMLSLLVAAGLVRARRGRCAAV